MSKALDTYYAARDASKAKGGHDDALNDAADAAWAALTEGDRDEYAAARWTPEQIAARKTVSG